ncbi:hypothetical protein VNO77_37671 [Canavalia gladiata]|uniref:Uncharacterized protein n=1 Tax=Canavalia gladiata TaxID=3824 RepID=A0AAN9KBB6_CANGL
MREGTRIHSKKEGTEIYGEESKKERGIDVGITQSDGHCTVEHWFLWIRPCAHCRRDVSLTNDNFRERNSIGLKCIFSGPNPDNV